ncbi:MAG: hypothetical protein M1832_001800 [Thelocarpon impressellum]|nr:MAG: hypothetical protein M1832_001800 [Thelocarpon impressellum]
MSMSTLSALVTQLSDAHRTTSLLITRLSKLPYTPGSVAADDAVRVELGAEIHARLKEQDDALELLRQEVDDLPGLRGSGDDDRARLEVGVRRLGEDLRTYAATSALEVGCPDESRARALFRRAQLQAKRNAEGARRKERDLLFSGAQGNGTTPSTPKRRGGTSGSAQEKLSQDELAANASQDVTAALRRTHQLLSTELQRSQYAHETLQESTAALTTLADNYSTLDTLLDSSRTLLGSLLRSQKSDTWYLETAFYILLSTIVWLIFRRFLYGPLWWLVWLPLKLSFRLIASILASAGLVGGAATSAAGSTSLIVKPSATGGFPTWGTGSMTAAPSVAVGGGSKGTDEGHSLVEEVGRMAEEVGRTAEETRKEDGQREIGEETSEEVKGNPKKRMWEEDVEADKVAGQEASEDGEKGKEKDEL